MMRYTQGIEHEHVNILESSAGSLGSLVKLMHSSNKTMEQVECLRSSMKKVNNFESLVEQVSNSDNSVRHLYI